MLRRALALPVVLALLAAACGDAATPDAPSVSTPATAAEVAGAEPTAAAPAPAASPDPTTAATGGTATAFDGPAAPDFALALQNRQGEFVLSEAATPVYLTFWAEW